MDKLFLYGYIISIVAYRLRCGITTIETVLIAKKIGYTFTKKHLAFKDKAINFLILVAFSICPFFNIFGIYIMTVHWKPTISKIIEKSVECGIMKEGWC